MALIPGTLPNDTCYGTPQDLLELFAQYLDVPAFALNSKVVFGTSSAGLTADVVWFDTTTATNPIMKITVSGGFTDYIKNYITNAPVVTIVGADSVLILDASDSGNTKKGLVSDIVALAVPAAGSITPSQLSQPFTSGTAVATTSGTAVDFTGIPSWVKRVTVMFNGVSVSGTSPFLVQLGTGAGPTFTSSGYTSIGISFGGSGLTSTARTNGFAFADTVSAAYTYGGNAVIAKVSGNIYSFNSTLAAATVFGDGSCVGAGSVSLGAILTSIRITTVNGTDTFDAGSINIMYE
jgi:hypothetical protein